jgi:hypothetical protein
MIAVRLTAVSQHANSAQSAAKQRANNARTAIKQRRNSAHARSHNDGRRVFIGERLSEKCAPIA